MSNGQMYHKQIEFVAKLNRSVKKSTQPEEAMQGLDLYRMSTAVRTTEEKDTCVLELLTEKVHFLGPKSCQA